MDPVSTAFSVVKLALQAIEFAKTSGYLGGSTSWVDYASDFAAITQNFLAFAQEAAQNPGVYDSLTEAQIRARLTPEGWDAKEARIRREMGKA